jgi:hypothetical protein
VTEVSKQGRGISLIVRSYLKKWTTYLITLVIVSFLIVCIRLIFTDSIVIYVQKNKPDFIQVFFPINGGYSEENSERSTLPEEASNEVRLPLPLVSFDHIRVDPANEAVDIFIKKIELRHLFGTETYMPDDLISRVKPIQMIGKLEVTPTGLLIRSTGNDPAFELKLNSPSVLFQLIMFGIVSILLSLFILFGITKWSIKKEQIEGCYQSIMPSFLKENLSALISIVIVWGLILYAVYPGFMSYDSLHALREAREGVQGGGYPTFVSYVWRVFDFLWPGPTLMMISQNFLLLFSIGVLLKKLNYSDMSISILMIFIALLPPLLGTMIVVWKDVSVAACFCASIVCFKSAETSANKTPLITGFCFLFCAAAFRVNAISAVIPLLMWIAYRRYFSGWGIVRSLLISFIIFVVILGSVNIINNYRFPSFERIAPNPGFQMIMGYDLVGISVFASKTMLPFNDSITGKAIAIEYLNKIYDPRHINMTVANDTKNSLAPLKTISGKIIRESWLEAVANNPLSYLKHRTAMFAELIGANSKPMFYPTHAGVDPNEYGISYNMNKSTSILLIEYILLSSNTIFCKPWFYYLTGFFSIIFVGTIKRKVDFSAMLFIFLSGFFYILPFFFITPAADLRYNLWAVTAMIITLLIAIGPTSSAKETT